jgi:Ser/Thr protein kinase RdoA (MazF antagonist)
MRLPCRMTDRTSAQPYADLTPEHALDILEAVGIPVDGRMLQLNSYENRVFQVGLDDGSLVVAKFYRPGRWRDEQILEEHAFALDLAAAEVPAVPPLTLTLPDPPWRELGGPARVIGTPPTLGLAGGHRVAVSPRRGGRPPELEDPEVLRWLGRFLARLHQVGDRKPFQHRATLNVQQHGRAARDSIANSPLLDEAQARRWLQLADQALDLCDQAFANVPDLRMRRIHGDCHPGNILWTPDGPHFVDLDDACMGPAVQDLWMLCGDPADRQVQLHALLDGYEAIVDFDWREMNLIEPLRTLRIIHHSDWLARRWHDPAFPAAFPWFGEPTYWQQQCGLLMQQIEAMGEALHPTQPEAGDIDWD